MFVSVPNVGNTCYLGGALQALSAAGPELVQDLDRLIDDQTLLGTSVHRFAVAIRGQLASMGSRPTAVLAALNEEGNRFPLNQQHSALDALLLILEKLRVERTTAGEGQVQQGSNLFTRTQDVRNRCLDCGQVFKGKTEEASVYNLKPQELTASGAALGDFISRRVQQVVHGPGNEWKGCACKLAEGAQNRNREHTTTLLGQPPERWVCACVPSFLPSLRCTHSPHLFVSC